MGLFARVEYTDNEKVVRDDDTGSGYVERDGKIAESWTTRDELFGLGGRIVEHRDGDGNIINVQEKRH